MLWMCVHLCCLVFACFSISPLPWIFAQTTSMPLNCVTYVMLPNYLYIQFLMCVCSLPLPCFSDISTTLILSFEWFFWAELALTGKFYKTQYNEILLGFMAFSICAAYHQGNMQSDWRMVHNRVTHKTCLQAKQKLCHRQRFHLPGMWSLFPLCSLAYFVPYFSLKMPTSIFWAGSLLSDSILWYTSKLLSWNVCSFSLKIAPRFLPRESIILHSIFF